MDAIARSRSSPPPPNFGELFTPKLVTVLREGYGGAQLRADAAMTAAYTKKTSDTLVRVTRDGDALVTTT